MGVARTTLCFRPPTRDFARRERTRVRSDFQHGMSPFAQARANESEERLTKRKRREAKARAQRRDRARRRYYETPRAWSHRCKDCGAEHSAYFKPQGNVYLCAGCGESRGVNPRPSSAMKSGGGQTDPSVRVSFVDPASIDF